MYLQILIVALAMSYYVLVCACASEVLASFPGRFVSKITLGRQLGLVYGRVLN